MSEERQYKCRKCNNVFWKNEQWKTLCLACFVASKAPDDKIRLSVEEVASLLQRVSSYIVYVKSLEEEIAQLRRYIHRTQI